MNSSLKGTKVNECLISVDIEATGPTPGRYSMYELGACLVANTRIRFERLIAPLPGGAYDAGALHAVNTTAQKILGRRGVCQPAHAMTDFATWVTKVSGTNRPVFVANNAPFDWMFVAWYFAEFSITNPFGHSALDMKAYFMGHAGCPWGEATLVRMADNTKMPKPALPHRAVLDAVIQARIFRNLYSTKETT